MWGQEIPFIINMVYIRIIPTRVGTSSTKCAVVRAMTDHPHACGDKPWGVGEISHSLGSSPRVWGQVKLLVLLKDNIRIIPTRVGTSCYNKLCPHCVGDHPHACGDKLFLGYHRLCCHGSSPRMWGQGQIINNFITKIRIIPTRVGTSI